MLCVIYARVSTDEQAERGFSLAEQLRLCRQRAAELANGQPLSVAEFTDDASGELLERPGLQAALALCRTGQVDRFICLDPDRLARKLVHQLLVADLIERSGARLEFLDHHYAETPEGRLFFHLRGAIAEFEKAKILERTLRGRRAKVEAGGLPHWIALYGYRHERGAAKGKVPAREALRVDPEEAAWVRRIFEWLVHERLTPRQIAQRLNDLGVPGRHGGRWTRDRVWYMLRNPAYMGQLRLHTQDWRGVAALKSLPPAARRRLGLRPRPRPRAPHEWAHVEVEPIIPRELWEQAQSILDHLARTRRVVPGERGNRMLTGLGRCGLCGAKLVYNGNRMACSHRAMAGLLGISQPCSLPAKSARLVEDAVWRVVSSWIADPGVLRQAARLLAASKNDQPAPDPRREVEHLRAVLRRKEEEAERIGMLFARGLWSEAQALPRLEQLKEEMANIRARIDELAKAAPARRPPARPPLSDQQLAEVARRLDELSYAERAELVRMCVDHFVLRPSPRHAPAVVEVYPLP